MTFGWILGGGDEVSCKLAATWALCAYQRCEKRKEEFDRMGKKKEKRFFWDGSQR
jgi:hypothetical protein